MIMIDELDFFMGQPLTGIKQEDFAFLREAVCIIPRHTLVSGYYVIPFGVCPSVRAHHFRLIT